MDGKCCFEGGRRATWETVSGKVKQSIESRFNPRNRQEGFQNRHQNSGVPQDLDLDFFPLSFSGTNSGLLPVVCLNVPTHAAGICELGGQIFVHKPVVVASRTVA